MVGCNAGCLHTVEGKEDGLDDARLAGAVVPEDTGDTVRELDGLVPEPFEVLEDEPVNDHQGPPGAGP